MLYLYYIVLFCFVLFINLFWAHDVLSVYVQSGDSFVQNIVNHHIIKIPCTAMLKHNIYELEDTFL